MESVQNMKEKKDVHYILWKFSGVSTSFADLFSFPTGYLHFFFYRSTLWLDYVSKKMYDTCIRTVMIFLFYMGIIWV